MMCHSCQNVYVRYRRMFSVPNLKCMFLLTVLLFILLTAFTAHMPWSVVYKQYHSDDDTFTIAKQLNAHRLDRAWDYFKGKDANESKAFYNSKLGQAAPDIVVSIITVRRLDFTDKALHNGYLIQTAAFMDKLIRYNNPFDKTVFFVCNVDKYPVSHVDAVFVQEYLPYIQKHGPNSFNRKFHVSKFNSSNENEARAHELEDYMFCLNASHSFNSSYILMLEDDVLPYSNALQVVHQTLLRHDFLPVDSRKFSFVKLYYPEKWQGYAFEPIRLLELLSACVVGGAIFVIAFACCYRSSRYSTLLFWYFFGAFVTCLSVSIVGRQNVMNLRRLSPQLFHFGPTSKCCTPAMFYSSSIIPDMIEYLMSNSHINKDLAIFDFIQKINVPGYQLEPNLFHHIGMFTSLNQGHYKSPMEFIFEVP